ncbi:MAG: molybdenum cofactor cytidylyltransferase [Acidobacteriota bacterium]|jgi:CTP:molybdopterin cytidylyltransferase MocA|nr:molybdenum cofactor cytidylyltransferase [Acidobacteriota bacterium]
MISAILLAAGQSRRMGAFKPLLAFGERTVIEACIGNLREGGVEEIVVVIGHRPDELRERLAYLPVRFAVNADAESEMGVSIARGVEQLSARAQAVFIALVDQPAIPPEVIRFLIAERARSDARLVVPEYEGRGGHPVLIDLGYRRELLNLDPQRGLRALFDAHRPEVLRARVASPYVARDMDQWDDYRALYREVFGTEPPENSGQ